MHILRLAAVLVVLTFMVPSVSAQQKTYTLTKDEALLVQRIYRNDQLVADMVRSQKGLETIATIAGRVVTGPAKLAISWNQAAIKGWRTANTNLAKINKAVSCNDIQLAILDGGANQEFFEQFSKARGCDE